MNPLEDGLASGTFGELLVQLRLLMHGVQAAPPLKDTGNDLIAVRENRFNAIQVKTTTTDAYDPGNYKERLFHVLAVVFVPGDIEFTEIKLDGCEVFLIPHETIENAPRGKNSLNQFRLTQELVDKLWAN